MIKGWRRLYQVRLQDFGWDFGAFVYDVERDTVVNRIGGIDGIPEMSESAALNAGLYIVAEREWRAGAVRVGLAINEAGRWEIRPALRVAEGVSA